MDEKPYRHNLGIRVTIIPAVGIGSKPQVTVKTDDSLGFITLSPEQFLALCEFNNPDKRSNWLLMTETLADEIDRIMEKEYGRD